MKSRFGHPASEPHGAHRGFRAAGNEADFFKEGDCPGDESGEFQFQFRGYSKTGAPLSLVRNSRRHGRVGVPQEHGAPRTNVIQQYISVSVVEMLTVATFNDQWLPAHRTKCADGAVDASHEDFFRLLENGF